MKKLLVISSIFLILNFSSGSQNKFYLDGYLFNFNFLQMKKSYYNIQNQPKYQNIDRLRLRPKINFSENINFTLEYETFIFYKNYSQWHIDNYKNTTGQLIDLYFTLIDNKLWKIAHFIDRMYLKIDYGEINLTLGRQRIAWGSGRIWNPTDLFNPISPTNFTKIEKDGIDAAVIKYNFSSLTDLSFVVNPTVNRSNYAVRFRTNFNEFDFSLVTGKFKNNFFAGADFAGNLLNAGVRGEMIVLTNKIKYILGIDYQFTPKLYSLIEYHFNGAGKSKKELYDFNDLLIYNTIYLAKNYIVVQFMYLVHPLSTISLLMNKNLNDESNYLSLNLSYSLLDNLNFNWITNIFSGNRNTEFYYYPCNIIFRTEYFF